MNYLSVCLSFFVCYFKFKGCVIKSLKSNKWVFFVAQNQFSTQKEWKIKIKRDIEKEKQWNRKLGWVEIERDIEREREREIEREREG